MKELKTNQIINTHYPVKPVRSYKRWAIAKSKTYNKPLMMQNSCVEAAYIRIVKAVKNTFMAAGTTYYEKDSRTDKSDGLMAMHSFITPDFYFHLQCNFEYHYEVEYSFGDCSYEGIIREMLKAYPLDRQAIEKQFKPDYDTFYKSVMLMLDPQYIHTL